MALIWMSGKKHKTLGVVSVQMIKNTLWHLGRPVCVTDCWGYSGIARCYRSEWRETHPEEFQETKNKVAAKIGENVADKPVDPGEPEARLL